MGLVNVLDLKPGGLGSLGAEQLEWIERDVKHLSSSTPIVVFAHVPLWSVYPAWGWGTDDGARALGYLKRFGSVSVLNGPLNAPTGCVAAISAPSGTRTSTSCSSPKAKTCLV